MKTNIRIFGLDEKWPKESKGRIYAVWMVNCENKEFTVWIEGDSEADVRESAETIYDDSQIRSVDLEDW
jgi:hypothetical protein